jgi:predicted MFS family arabinose efflux permease
MRTSARARTCEASYTRGPGLLDFESLDCRQSPDVRPGILHLATTGNDTGRPAARVPPASAPASAQASPVALAIAGMFTLAVAMAIGRFAFTPLLPMMQADSGLSLAAGAALASANYLGYLAGSALAMAMTAATHRTIRAGLMGVTLGTLAMAWADSLWLWFVLRFLTGVASAWVLIFAATWMFNRLAEAGQPRWGSFVFTGIGCGIAATGFACMAMVMAQAGAQATWLVIGLASALCTAGVWRFYQPQAAGSAPAVATGRAPFAPDAWRLIIAYGLAGVAYIVPATFLPLMAREALAGSGSAAWVYAGFWPLAGIAAAISTLLTLRLRVPDDRQLRAALVAQAVGVAAPALSPHPLAIALSAVLVGGTFVLITLTSLRVARQVEPLQATRLFAVMTTWFALGQVAGPIAAERLVAWTGGFGAALAMAGVSLAVAVALTPVGPRRGG